MFGVDFSELMVIMLVALVVIGPERLPKVARTMGHLWSRAQRYINGVKADISRDMALDELRQLQQKVQQEASSVEQAVRQVEQSLAQQAQQLDSAMAQPAHDIAPHATVDSHAPSGNSNKTQLELQLPTEHKKFPVD